MAKTGATALTFITDLHGRVHAAFGREARELEAFKAEQTQTPPARLAPWETAFWAERLRRSRYAGLAPGRLRPGDWRELTRDEVRRLRRLVGL